MAATLPLIILLAAYGSGDFTHIARNYVKDNTLTIEAENAIFSDPWVGYLKTLVVVYQYGDYKPVMALVQEHQTLTITPTAENQQPWDRSDTLGLKILGAAYGITDVTSKVQSKIVNDGLTLMDLDNTLGDGWVGHPETLVICYQYSTDTTQGIVVRTDGQVNLVGPQLTILKAAYGLEDVTSTVQNLVSKQAGTRLDTLVSNTIFKDNWSGIAKTLVIVYQYKDFTPSVIAKKDSEKLIIAYQTKTDKVEKPTSETQLQILGAAYGPVDVTGVVKKRVVDNHLMIDAWNNEFGNTWENNKKSLVVVYKIGNKAPEMKIAPDVSIVVPNFMNYIDI